MQPRFERRIGRYPYRLLEVPRFRAGYDFMLLRSQTGSCNASLGEWWTDFIHADLPGREELLTRAKDEDLQSGQMSSNPNKKRRRRSKKPRKGAEKSADTEMDNAKQE
jgi:poly(A) polymerase